MKKISTLLAVSMLTCAGAFFAMADGTSEKEVRSWDFTKGGDHAELITDGDYWTSAATANAKGRATLNVNLQDQELCDNDGKALPGLEGLYFTTSATGYYGITGTYRFMSNNYSVRIPSCAANDTVIVKFCNGTKNTEALLSSENLSKPLSTTSTSAVTDTAFVVADGDVVISMPNKTTCLFNITVKPEIKAIPEPEPETAMLLFADATLSYEYVEGCGETEADNVMTWDNGFKLVLQNSTKGYSSASNITIDGESYKTTKLSNGADNILYAPEGYVITKLILYSYVNKDAATERDAYWANIDGTAYTYEQTPLTAFKGDTANPDKYEFPIDSKASVNFKNTGEQPCIVLAVEYVEGTPAEEPVEPVAPAAPEYTSMEAPIGLIYNFTVAEGYEFYKYFVEDPGQAAAGMPEPTPIKTMDVDDMTFAMASPAVLLSKYGTLYYFVYDPATNSRCEVQTIVYSEPQQEEPVEGTTFEVYGASLEYGNKVGEVTTQFGIDYDTKTMTFNNFLGSGNDVVIEYVDRDSNIPDTQMGKMYNFNVVSGATLSDTDLYGEKIIYDIAGLEDKTLDFASIKYTDAQLITGTYSSVSVSTTQANTLDIVVYMYAKKCEQLTSGAWSEVTNIPAYFELRLSVPSTQSGIADVVVDEVDENAPVEYYNLQGIRINEPTPGQIVIRRQGNKATKIVVR